MIHKTAIIDSKAKISSAVNIGPYSIIGPNVEIKKNTNEMYEEITSTKFGICSGGLTTYEFASMKIPFIILCQHKHQLLTANEWEKQGFGKNLGVYNKISEREILEIIEKIENNNIIFKNKITVDGKGALRVANEIRKLDRKSHL